MSKANEPAFPTAGVQNPYTVKVTLDPMQVEMLNYIRRAKRILQSLKDLGLPQKEIVRLMDEYHEKECARIERMGNEPL